MILFFTNIKLFSGTCTGLDNTLFERKIVIISYQSVISQVLGAQKNRLIETVLLSTHKTRFGLEVRKNDLVRTPN